MQYEPHDYQRFAAEHIIKNPIAALFLDMGLGKTVTTLTAIHELVLDRFEVQKVLVIAPLRVARDTWPVELKKWEHLQGLTYSLVMGSEEDRIAALKKKAHIYLINRENVSWLIEQSKQKFDFDMVVVDELSSFKNSKSKRFRSLMRVRARVKRFVGLTGTPASNGFFDLWAEFRLLDMGHRLGRYISVFRNLFFVPQTWEGYKSYVYRLKPGAEQQICQLIGDITVSMKATDYLDMPECIINEVPVYLSDEERREMGRITEGIRQQYFDEDLNMTNGGVVCGKLLQMANGAVYTDDGFHLVHDRKLDALEDLIEGANGKPVLVAYWFRHDLERIKERFQVREIKSTMDINDWNEGKIPVAVINPASAGHGLNIQRGGSTLIWFGLTWSLELYQQTNARLWRQGQIESTVVIHHIIAKDTIDEDVMHVLKLKEKCQDLILNIVKARLEKS